MRLGLSLALGRAKLMSSTTPFVPPVPSYTGTMTTVSGEDDTNYLYYRITDGGVLTFDKAATFDLERISAGGTGGGGQYQVGAGGGGGGARVTSTETYTSGDLTVSLGAPGAKTGHNEAPVAGTPLTITELSISDDPGGTGGNSGGTTSYRYGLAGGCGGGAEYQISNAIYQAAGDPGGNGGVNLSGTLRQGGGGGGMGGNGEDGAGTAQAAGGAGVTSWLGDTVCAGGDGGWNQTTANGADATGYGNGGDGGSTTGTTAVTGGSGAPARLVVRIAKAFEMSKQSITAETVYNVPYPLNAALTSAQVPLAFTTTVDGTYEARPVYHADETAAGSWISLGSVSGSYSGTVTVPVCDAAVRWEVRRVGEASTRTFVQQGMPWITAFTMLAGGQSNMVGWWPGAKDSVAEDGTEALSQAYACFVAADNSEADVEAIYGLNYCNSTALRNFTEEWYGLTGIPICVMHGGRGSSRIRTHVASWDATPDYSIFSKYQQALELIGYCHAILWYQGEADAIDASSEYPQYVADAETLRSDVAGINSQTATDIVWLSIDISTWSGATTPQIELWQDFKLLQKDWSNQMTTNGYCRPINGDFVRKDTYHTSMNEGGYDRLGSRAGVIMAYAMGQTSDPGRFRVTAAAATNTTTTTLTLTHNSYGSDFDFVTLDHEADPVKYYPDAAASSSTLFQVSIDGGTTPVSCTGVRTDATTITLTHAAISTTGRTYRVRGDAAVDEAVVDNSAFTFPLEFTDWTACT